MSGISEEMTVREIVLQRPGRAPVLEERGLDYCCGGDTPLAEACATRGLDVGDVVRALLESDAAPQPEERNWTDAGLGQLIDNILVAHHAYLRDAMPRIAAFLNKVANKHGERKPLLVEARNVFEGFVADMDAHLVKEERVLFPMILAMEQGRSASGFPPSVAGPIRVMEMEHDTAGEALARLRRLMDDYQAPEEMCGTYRVMLDEMARLEANTHQHVHKENNILFPRAVALEHMGSTAQR